MPDYLTTRELAELLRLKERKIYDLAASGRLPCTKVTGKLLFPRDEIEALIQAGQVVDAVLRPTSSAPAYYQRTRDLPAVVLGSHDPLLDWALRESQAGLATYFDSSRDGLDRFAAGKGVATGLHIYDPDMADWNTRAVLGEVSQRAVVLIEWCKRQRGLALSPGLGEKVRRISDLAGTKFAARQPEAGAELLFRHLTGEAGLVDGDINVVLRARSEADAAIAVVEGKADAAFGLESVAAQYRLDFVPIIEERFDLLVDRRAWFEPAMQRLVQFSGSMTFGRRARELAGCDASGWGRVRWNGAG